MTEEDIEVTLSSLTMTSSVRSVGKTKRTLMEPRLLGTQRILNFPKCSCHGQSHSHHHDDQDQDEMNEVIEVSIHECPPALRHDFKLVFPSVQLQPPPSSSLSSSSSSSRRLLVVPTFQRATCSLLATGDLPESEKDRLLNNVRHSLSPYPYPYSLSPAMEPPLPSSSSLSLPSSNHGACQCVAACGNLVNGQTSPTLPPVSLFVHHPLSLPLSLSLLTSSILTSYAILCCSYSCRC